MNDFLIFQFILVIVIASKGYELINKVGNNIKTMIKDETLFNKVKNINNNTNNIDIDKIAIAQGFKKRV